jgi:hypothetical protein
MYHTRLDPFTGEEVYVAKQLRDRRLEQAWLRFVKLENNFAMGQALLGAGRSELIGTECDCLIPAHPPKSALQARMARPRRELTEGRYVPTIEPDVPPGASRHRSGRAPGYRSHRKSIRWRPR